MTYLDDRIIGIMCMGNSDPVKLLNTLNFLVSIQNLRNRKFSNLRIPTYQLLCVSSGNGAHPLMKLVEMSKLHNERKYLMSHFEVPKYSYS